MNAELSPSASLAPEPALPSVAGSLLQELVAALTEPRPVGTVDAGRPHLLLFGEPVDLAVPMRMLLDALRRGDPARVELDEDTLARHDQATRDADGYWVSVAGMDAGRSTRADESLGEAISLRLCTSAFCDPMNELLRADPADPETWLAVVLDLRGAVERRRGGDDRPADDPLARRMDRLHEQLRGLSRLDDPRLPRLLGELLVHAWMAMRALARLRPYLRDGGSSDRLHRVCSLPSGVLAELRGTAGRGGVWRDLGSMSTTPRRGGDRTHHAHTLEIRPLFRGSAGRWLDGSVDDGVSPQVVFPPGTPFEVLETVEYRAEDGSTRTLVRLSELSRPAAALREGAPLPAPRPTLTEPVYHYTLGVALSGIVDDGAIGVSTPPPGVEAPVVWLSMRDDWEPSAVESMEPREHLERGRGRFRIAVDPELPLLTMAQWVRWADVPADEVAILESRGRERGADPRQWYCCPFSIGREHWRSIEVCHPELGWVPVER